MTKPQDRAERTEYVLIILDIFINQDLSYVMAVRCALSLISVQVLSEFMDEEVADVGYKIALYKMFYALCSKCGMQCNN